MLAKNRILILMCISMMLGYMPWYNFSAVSKYITTDFGLTAGDMGTILSAFQVGYVVTVIATGWLADRVGNKNVVAWATLSTGVLSTMFAWLVRDFASILVLRLLTGLSAGAIYAPGMSLLSGWFPSNERGRALGAYTAALTAAYASGYLVASSLGSIYSWRIGILGTSLPVFIAAFIMFFLVEESPKNIERGNDAAKEAAKRQRNSVPAKAAPKMGYSGPVLIITAYMGHMWELYAFWGWVGPFMVANSIATGYGESRSVFLGGLLSTLIILVGVPAVWLLGMLSDKLGRTRTITFAALCSLVAEFFFGYLYGQSLALVVMVGVWIGFWVIADSSIYKAGLTEMVREDVRSTALGIQSAAGYAMTIPAPLVFGKLLEALNGRAIDPTQATSWGPPFAILGIGALLAPVSALILSKLPQAKLMARKE